MTAIAFHVNVADKLGYSCRLLRKAYLSGAKVAVTGEPEVLGELDRLLWSYSPAQFVPHCFAGAPERIVAATPILLTGSPAAATQHEVLVNIGQTVPADFEHFQRFIEVVALAGDDAAAGRGRWKHYVALGYDLAKHDMARREELS